MDLRVWSFLISVMRNFVNSCWGLYSKDFTKTNRSLEKRTLYIEASWRAHVLILLTPQGTGDSDSGDQKTQNETKLKEQFQPKFRVFFKSTSKILPPNTKTCRNSNIFKKITNYFISFDPIFTKKSKYYECEVKTNNEVEKWSLFLQQSTKFCAKSWDICV